MAFPDALRRPLTELAESALNQALALDPATRTALLAELDEPLGMEAQPPGLTLTLARHGDGISLRSDRDTDPPVVVRGPPLALLALALGDRSPLDQGRLVIEGQSQRVTALMRVLAELDPDLESVLAGPLGDVPAHLLARRLRRLLAWTRQASGALMANLEDYVQEEAGVVPPRNEAEVLFDDIRSLEAETSTLEARIETLRRSMEAGGS